MRPPRPLARSGLPRSRRVPGGALRHLEVEGATLDRGGLRARTSPPCFTCPVQRRASPRQGRRADPFRNTGHGRTTHPMGPRRDAWRHPQTGRHRGPQVAAAGPGSRIGTALELVVACGRERSRHRRTAAGGRRPGVRLGDRSPGERSPEAGPPRDMRPVGRLHARTTTRRRLGAARLDVCRRGRRPRSGDGGGPRLARRSSERERQRDDLGRTCGRCLDGPTTGMRWTSRGQPPRRQREGRRHRTRGS